MPNVTAVLQTDLSLRPSQQYGADVELPYQPIVVIDLRMMVWSALVGNPSFSTLK